MTRTQNFILTPRDLALLVELGEMGLMTAAMLTLRHFSGFTDTDSAQRSFRRRMKRFLAHRIVSLECVPAAAGGNRILQVYRLTQTGADLVAELTGTRPTRAGSSPTLNPVTVPHRLGIVSTRLAVDDAHRRLALPLPAWLFEYDLAPTTSPTAPNDQRFLLYESFRVGDKRHVCWPDAAVRIRLTGQTTYELLAYIEYDRSTESSRQIAAKSEPYQLLVEQRRYERHWQPSLETPLVRVLFVARSEQRIKFLAEALRNTRGANLFRFATYRDAVPERILTEPVWQSVDGQRLCVLRPNPSLEV
jgi:hypothetical protein